MNNPNIADVEATDNRSDCTLPSDSPDMDATRFRTTVECAPIGIAHVRPDGGWLWVNDYLCSLVGYSREELLTRTFQDITFAEDLDGNTAQFDRLVRGDIPSYSHDKRYVRKDAELVWVHLTVSLVSYADGQPAYVIAVIEDIGDRKRLEDEHRHLLSIVGHEISTPLTTLKARAQLLRREVGRLQAQTAPAPASRPDAATQHLNAMDRAVAQLERQAMDLRAASHADQGLLTMDVAPCDLVALCAQTVEGQQGVENGRIIRLHAPSTPVVVEADSARLAQSLTNLLTNAVKYTPVDRPVTVTVRRNAHTASIAVRDQGPGIAPDAIPHLFKRFYRAPGVKARAVGAQSLGLGLYIARTIVDRHGGALTVESKPGAGATFTITLPLLATADNAGAIKQASVGAAHCQ